MIEPMTILVAFVSVVISVIGWLLLRAIKGVDQSIAALGTKVDGLAAQDSLILIQLEGLRARVNTLEFLVHGSAKGSKP